jgi:hypothetical protein
VTAYVKAKQEGLSTLVDDAKETMSDFVDSHKPSLAAARGKGRSSDEKRFAEITASIEKLANIKERSQKRLLSAFPNLKSPDYTEALKWVREKLKKD